jgi:hypothetical protein
MEDFINSLMSSPAEAHAAFNTIRTLGQVVDAAQDAEGFARLIAAFEALEPAAARTFLSILVSATLPAAIDAAEKDFMEEVFSTNA